MREHVRRLLLIGGIIFLMIAVILPTQDRHSGAAGVQRDLISRQGEPATYWGLEAALAFISATLFAIGIYQGRQL
jgi:hypothetical protein